MVRIFQSHPVTLDGTYHLLDSLILCDDMRLEVLRHAFQSDTLLLCHALYGDPRHHRHHVLHLFLRDRLFVVDIPLLPFAVHLRQLALHHRLAVAEACGKFEVLVLDSQLFLLRHLFQFQFQLCDLRGYLYIIKMYA